MKAKLLICAQSSLIRPKSSLAEPQTFDDQAIIPGVHGALNLYRSRGWDIALVSDQPGLRDGTKKLEQVWEEMVYLLELTDIDRACFCPDDGYTLWQTKLVHGQPDHCHRTQSSAECAHMDSFKAPGIGMLQWLAEAYGPLYDCLFVGDREEDYNAVSAAEGVRFMWDHMWLVDAVLAH